MCNSVDSDRIQNKVAEFVAEGKVFTAFDVTKALRSEFPDFEERHRGVRRVVRSTQMDGYDSAGVNLVVAGDKAYAIAYFPTGKAATDHPLAIAVDPSVKGATDTIADAIASVSTDGSTPVLFKTKDDRIQLPKYILDKFPSATVQVNLKGNVLIYTKNKDGRVRVMATDSQPSYTVSFDDARQEVVLS